MAAGVPPSWQGSKPGSTFLKESKSAGNTPVQLHTGLELLKLPKRSTAKCHCKCSQPQRGSGRTHPRGQKRGQQQRQKQSVKQRTQLRHGSSILLAWSTGLATTTNSSSRRQRGTAIKASTGDREVLGNICH